MKTVQDWGFISKEQDLAKPKLQDNKIFHALTSAYENNQQHEIYGATENIVRREKELCEFALADLQKLSGKSDPDGTLKLVMEHYSQRLGVAKEKEEKINRLSEDSRKMMEEYKKRTQELADVKRNLMESQAKLRELAKSTEKLIKKEEELRFIETNLRTELDKNKRNIINGLYEIVAEISESADPAAPAIPQVLAASATLAEAAEAVRAGGQTQSENGSSAEAAPEEGRGGGDDSVAPSAREETIRPLVAESPNGRMFTEGLFRRASDTVSAETASIHPPAPSAPSTPPTPHLEKVWTRDGEGTAAPLFNVAPAVPAVPAAATPFAAGPAQAAANTGTGLVEKVEKAARLKMFEPGKSLCSKSMVRTPEGEVISEYFYSPLHPKESRQYIFNSLYAVWSLLGLKARDENAFSDRLETVFSDLLSRLEHSQNIHLESFVREELNRETISRLMAAPRAERGALFESLATRLLGRIEAVGPGRAGLIDHQFKQLPKSEFPPREGIKA